MINSGACADSPCHVIPQCACQRSVPLTGQSGEDVSVSMYLDMWSTCAATLFLGWSVRQSLDLPSILKAFFSLCQTHCCLIVTNSNSLLLVLRQSGQSHSFCAGSLKAHLSESWIRKGGGGNPHLLCEGLQLYLPV